MILQEFLAIFASTFWPFVLSSVVATVVAYSLVRMTSDQEYQRLARFTRILHALPLFCAPLLLSMLIVKTAETYMGVEVRQSRLLLAFLGFIFHTFLNYLILDTLMDFTERKRRFAVLSANLTANAPLVVGLWIRRLGTPLALCVAISFVFQESMVSPSEFLDTRTLVSSARATVAGTDALGIRIFAFTVVAIGFLAIIWGTWAFFRLLGWLMIRFGGGFSMPNWIGQCSRPVSIICILLAVFSSVVHLAVAVIWLWCLVTPEVHSDNILWDIHSKQAFECLLNRSTFCAAIAVALITAVTLISMLAWPARMVASGDAWLRRIRITAAFAFVPAAAFGTFSLFGISGRMSQALVGNSTMIIYPFLMTLLFVDWNGVKRYGAMFCNASSMHVPLGRRGLLICLSPIGVLPLAALIATYFAWIEDGIQTVLFEDDRSFPRLLYGLSRDVLQPGTYTGIVACFVVWTVLAFLISFAQASRFSFISRLLTVLVFCGFLISVPSTAKAEDQHYIANTLSSTRPSTSNALLDVDSEYIATEGTTPIRLHISGSDATILVAKSANLVHIAELVIDSNQPTPCLRIIGAPGVHVGEFRVDQLSTNGSLPELTIDTLSIGRLQLRGQEQPAKDAPRINIRIGQHALIDELSLVWLTLPSATLYLQPYQRPEVTLKMTGVALSDFKARGGLGLKPEEFAHTAIDIQASLLKTEEMPQIRLSGLFFEGGSIELSAPTKTPIASVVSFDNVTFLPANNSTRFSITATGGASFSPISFNSAQLNGTLAIAVPEGRLDLNVFDVFTPERSASSGLEIAAADYGRIIAKDSGIAVIDIKPSGLDASWHDIPQLTRLRVSDVLKVPRELVDAAARSPQAFDRGAFFKLLQEKGIYAETEQPIGIDALYYRKRADMTSASPILTVVLDWTTGLGIQIWKPCITFFVIILCYLVVSVHLAKFHEMKTLRAGVVSALHSLLLPEAVHDGPKYQGYRHILRALFGFLLLLQVTLLSIYLGQTLLQ